MSRKSKKRPSPVVVVKRKPLKFWVNSRNDGLENALMCRCGFEPAKVITDADIMFFVGGADVNPHLYGEEAIPQTHFSVQTDTLDLYAFREAKNMFKVGICRGGQFLNVMNGGKLWQDVDNHTRSHELVDAFTGQKVMVSSTHHQQFRPAQDAVTIATARETTRKQSEMNLWSWKKDGTQIDTYFAIDHEVLYYPGTRSLCFQPHPEYSSPSTTAAYFEGVINKAIRGEYVKPEKKAS